MFYRSSELIFQTFLRPEYFYGGPSFRQSYNIDSLLSRKIFLGDDHGGEPEHGLVERVGPEPHVGLLVIQLLLAVAFGLDGHERADGGSCWAALVHFDQKICFSSILREIELEQLLDIR